MSAFLTDSKTPVAIAHALVERKIVTGLPVAAVAIALADENIASVNYRYTDGWGGEAEWCRDVLDAVSAPDSDTLAIVDDAARLATRVKCYRYQSCEHPAFRDGTSLAADWTEQLLDALGEQPTTEGDWS